MIVQYNMRRSPSFASTRSIVGHPRVSPQATCYVLLKFLSDITAIIAACFYKNMETTKR